jgi:hypothetical protein
MENNKITFVIRGRYEEQFKLCYNHIKQFYPESKIILSSWIDQIQSYLSCGLEFDQIVLDTDPKNINRQSLASFNGIKNAKTEYVCVLRPDILLLNQLPIPKSDSILVSDCYTINPFTNHEKLMFHVSDWLYFGKKYQLASLFSHALNPTEYKCRPEQFPILNWLNITDWKDDHEFSIEIQRKYNNMLFNYFEIINANEPNTFIMAKYPYVKADGQHFLREIK